MAKGKERRFQALPSHARWELAAVDDEAALKLGSVRRESLDGGDDLVEDHVVEAGVGGREPGRSGPRSRSRARPERERFPQAAAVSATGARLLS